MEYNPNCVMAFAEKAAEKVVDILKENEKQPVVKKAGSDMFLLWNANDESALLDRFLEEIKEMIDFFDLPENDKNPDYAYKVVAFEMEEDDIETGQIFNSAGFEKFADLCVVPRICIPDLE